MSRSPLRRISGVLLLLPAIAQAASGSAVASTQRDGQHDFDFNFGVWHTHIRRVLNPFKGGNLSVELDGTVTVRKVWEGRAWLEEIETNGPNGHWEGMTLFFYNPQARQWSQSFVNSKVGTLAAPLVGEFKSGRGDLYSQDTYEGRTVLVRGVWSGIQPDSHDYTKSYSDDGGATWRPVFVAHLTRQEP